MARGPFLAAIEGGGTRTEAAILDLTGRVLGTGRSGDVNVNFAPIAHAQAVIREALTEALRMAEVAPDEVRWAAHALVSSPGIVARELKRLFPRASQRAYREGQVVFARGGRYAPHGVALVAATGATAWAVRRDTGEEIALGGWGSLLGDEGSAYAIGLAGLRAAARAWEGREANTTLVEAVAEHFDVPLSDFKQALIRLAYRKPLTRAEIASFAPRVTHAASEGDPVAQAIVEEAVEDLARLALHAAHRLFRPSEAFDIVIAGGLLAAGAIVVEPLRHRLLSAFPASTFIEGREPPAIALGRLALQEIARDEVMPC
ncbi:MAG: BadF/BadG/BcrA/BcrD ATPase family protein [Anaerolineae bacterium]